MINIHLYPSQFQNESRILREARTLSRLGLFDRIDLLGTGGAGLPIEEDLGGNVRIRRVGIRHNEGALVGKALAAAAWSRAIYGDYSRKALACVNCHSLTTLLLGVSLKRATGARLIYDAHELETETSGLGGIRKIGAKILERALIGRADYSIFVGKAIDDWYRTRYGLTRSAVIYNAPAFADIAPTDRFRESFGIARSVPVFLYQGVISEARGVPKLIEAFAALAGRAALVIMGYGDLAGWVKEQAARHPNVFYHPAVPPDELLEYTAAADYGLSVIEATSLSYEYCMPNKLFEYVMARKPVLVSPTREQREFVERYGVGEVTRDTSPTAIREGVERLLAHHSSVFAMALDKARHEFAWERQEMTLSRIYVEILGFRPRAVGAAS
jgi:glycosyltransferase involved in cell wall biosynthesis